MRNPNRIPGLVWLIAVLVLAAQAASVLLWITGKLHGIHRNLVPQCLLGGLIVLLGLSGYVLRHHAVQLRAAPARSALILAIIILVAFTGIYVLHARPIVTLPYDLASWSETYFVNDINKWHSGARLYVTPDDSNSSTYTPVAPMATYFVASALRHPTSIPLYRFIEQAFLVLAALFGAAATWNLVRLAMPERFSGLSRLWGVFFFFATFLLATNRWTNAFNVFLHNDALGVLATTAAFWLMTKHALSRNSRWLWAMAVMPSLAFLAKQYLAIWAAVYVLYLLLECGSIRRTAVFAMGTFVALGVCITACLSIWGSDFRYWVLLVMQQQVVSFVKMFNLFGVGAGCTLLGLLGGAILLRGRNTHVLLGMWLGWVIMLLAANYTAGIAYIPTHLGPATMVGGCFFLAALVSVWPSEDATPAQHTHEWLRAGMCVMTVVVLFAGLSYPLSETSSVPRDFYRYTRDIEREFDGEPPDRVLTDFGDWVYLRAGVVAKDRAAILPIHRDVARIGMLQRLRHRDYDRILVHNLHRPDFAYDRGGRTGVRRALLENYHEVRVIPGASGMEDWLYYQMMLSDVSVLEPISPGTPPGRQPTASEVRAAVESTISSSR